MPDRLRLAWNGQPMVQMLVAPALRGLDGHHPVAAQADGSWSPGQPTRGGVLAWFGDEVGELDNRVITRSEVGVPAIDGVSASSCACGTDAAVSLCGLGAAPGWLEAAFEAVAAGPSTTS
jgi:hypothetical protein